MCGLGQSVLKLLSVRSRELGGTAFRRRLKFCKPESHPGKNVVLVVDHGGWIKMRLRTPALGMLCATLLECAAPAAAQIYTGRIEVAAVDATGAVLPGATVEI